MAPAQRDHGGARMEFLRTRKAVAFERLRTCRQDPTCPDVMMRDNEHYVPCVNGERRRARPLVVSWVGFDLTGQAGP